MNALVTGASGFAGRYLVAELRREGYDVLACGGPADGEFFPLDLLDASTIRAALDVSAPQFVFHLAAQTFVPDALASPMSTYMTNVRGTVNVLEAVRGFGLACGHTPRVVFVSSAEVYGRQPPDASPLREITPLSPANPYAASKAAGEMIVLGEARSFGIDVVIARAFNHIGPGQDERFAVANFARQLAAIAAGAQPVMLVGNLDARRDFCDVRDIVRAYAMLAKDGVQGETYNVCSGIARSIRDVLRELIIVAHVPVEVREDPDRMRPSDVPFFVGDNAKLRAATSWEPSIPFQRSIRDIYEAARKMSAS
ncbi:MAG: GDP-mannose 4,6-dehydratase [Candidatus Eremiobacteraeota bacterium]|nr:GDP-mannose 4,6-dehydratase [Candidatus Eremiobacteraeota bacterium]